MARWTAMERKTNLSVNLSVRIRHIIGVQTLDFVWTTITCVTAITTARMEKTNETVVELDDN